MSDAKIEVEGHTHGPRSHAGRSRAPLRAVARLRTGLARAALRGANRLGPHLRARGIARLDFDPDRLVAAAIARTGLEDFGGEPYRTPLEVLLRACDEEAGLNFIGRVATWWDTVRLLGNLLRLAADRRLRPGIAAEPVRAPVFILGLPRTGSTFLHALLAQDPALRSPLHWEVMHPSPPPGLASRGSDPRVRRTARELAWMDYLAPELRTAHALAAEDPQECTEILSNVFLSLRFDTTYEIPSYRAWLDRQGLEPAYRFHRRFLQHLQHGAPPRRWVLKSPDHVFALDALLSVYPDARIVMTHRDPLKVLPSVASLTVMLEAAFSDAVDPVRVGERIATRWEDGARRIIAAASSHPRMVHVHYRDLARFPLREVRRIYRELDLDFTPEAETRMGHYLRAHPAGGNGVHRYDPQRFGLDPQRLAERFEPYRARFGVEAETPATARAATPARSAGGQC